MRKQLRAAIYKDVSTQAGLNFHSEQTSRVHRNLRETLGNGCAFFDFDCDGHLDILLIDNDHVALYRNRGDGTFEDVSYKLPTIPPHTKLQGCSIADYDNDGWPDIFLTGYGRTFLFHNIGESGSALRVKSAGKTQNKQFVDVTLGSGLEARGPYDWTTSATWADVDGDGRLDLYVCRYVEFTPASNQLCSYVTLDGSSVKMACGPEIYPAQKGSLYHNMGGGRFRDITIESGLGNAHGKALGALFCDFNDDGLPDLYVSNDKMPGDLFVNVGKGHFRNIGVETGTAYGANGMTQAGMGLDWGDYDNDGRFDLLIATFEGEPKSLYHNEGRSLFTDKSYYSGIGAATLRTLAFGASFVDADNDGLLDIVFTNGHVLSEVEKVDPENSYPQPTQFFRNLGDGRFQDASAEAGPDFLRKIVGRGMALGDYDGDGRSDLLIMDAGGKPLLLHNESGTGNHWLTLRCKRTPNGADAIGARVTILVGKRKYVAEVRAGGSFLSSNAPEVHFGLGASTLIDRVEVRWTGGRKSVFRNISADQTYQVSPGGIGPR